MHDTTKIWYSPKCKVSNKWFSPTRFFPDMSLTFGQFPEISPTAVKFPHISRFSRHVVTFLEGSSCLAVNWLKCRSDTSGQMCFTMLAMTSIGLIAKGNHNTHSYQVTPLFFQLVISSFLAVSFCMDRQKNMLLNQCLVCQQKLLKC